MSKFKKAMKYTNHVSTAYSNVYNIPKKRGPKPKFQKYEFTQAEREFQTNVFDQYVRLIGQLPYKNIITTKPINYMEIPDEEWNKFFTMVCEIERARQYKAMGII